MTAVCVDDEELILQRTVSLVKKTNKFDTVEYFSDSEEALDYFNGSKADLALLDIDMPNLGGLDLATAIKERCPDIRIIFLTGYSEFAVDAYAMHATGYLLKPVSYDRLLSEIEYALEAPQAVAGQPSSDEAARVRIDTFGYFNITVEGKPIIFKRSKAKELLACLIDRRGQFISRKDLFYILWEDDDYDRAKQKYLDTIIRSLKDTLEEYEVSDIFEMEKGLMRVNPDKVDCDLYRFLDGDENAIKSFRGEYMSSYTWGSITEGYLTGLED